MLLIIGFVRAATFPRNYAEFHFQVVDSVRTFCEDGWKFIQTIAKRVHDDPLPPFTGPALSRTQQDKEKRRARVLQQTTDVLPKADSQHRKCINHFVMNLPDTAILFLGAFRGILAPDKDPDMSGMYGVMPMIHCHCFTRELDPQKAEMDIRQVGSMLRSRTQR